MNNTTFSLPLFPLPIFILPDGITRLRIFEPRYLKMVSMASQGQGFALVFVPEDKQMPEILWASRVEIVNFAQDDDGVLVIDVKCIELVDIKSISLDENKLQHGLVSAKPHWPVNRTDEDSHLLKEVLEKVFTDDPDLNELYAVKHFDDVNWTVARWLELLPMDFDSKYLFAQPSSFPQAIALVESIITTEK